MHQSNSISNYLNTVCRLGVIILRSSYMSTKAKALPRYVLRGDNLHEQDLYSHDMKRFRLSWLINTLKFAESWVIRFISHIWVTRVSIILAYKKSIYLNPILNQTQTTVVVDEVASISRGNFHYTRTDTRKPNWGNFWITIINTQNLW